MDPQFWLNKWEKQETGFHLASVHPLLQKFYSRAFNTQDGIFVPLCGKTSDLTFFAGKGSYTLGCELSKKAVEAFFDGNGLNPGKKQDGSMMAYRSESLDILVGDLFELDKSQLSKCHAIYDRASLIAFPPTMRSDYVLKLRSLFQSARMMLITLEYPQQEMKGPPFSVEHDEVSRLFSNASIEQVYRKNILSKEPKFEARGLSYLNECVYIIEW